MAHGPLNNMVRHIRRIIGLPGDVTDRALLARFAQHRDESAFRALVERHGPLVLGVCRRLLNNEHDAEDAFQATFLLLARKAGSVRWHESVGNWLYEAAYRIAAKARVQGARRGKHERQAATMLPTTSSPAPAWNELRGVLDEELARMPEKFRMPLLLCYLHGKTRDEAAEQLGWTLDTVKGRLERGREMLRRRLEQRGLALSAALLPGLLGQEGVAAMPAVLATITVESAITGDTAARVAVLLKGAMQAMFWTKVKRAALVLTLGVLASGAGTWALLASADGKDSGPSGKTAETKATAAMEPVNAEKVPAWGEPRDGLRVGLAPNQMRIAPGEKEITLTVWYENIGKAECQVPIHKGVNQYRLLLRGKQDDRDFYVPYSVRRTRTAMPKLEPLAPGKKVAETFYVPVEGKDGTGWTGLPALKAGQSLSLQMGLCPMGDPWGDKDWNAAETLKSGIITVTCDPQVVALKPVAIDVKEEGKTIKAVVGQNIELRLVSNDAAIGWHEQSVLKEPAVLVKLPGDFQPQLGSKDSCAGNYLYRFKAVAEGEQEITAMYISFGKPVPGQEDRLVKTFKVNINVTAGT
jgi:RNA polymerase sigma factor (sigma-70 family)